MSTLNSSQLEVKEAIVKALTQGNKTTLTDAKIMVYSRASAEGLNAAWEMLVRCKILDVKDPDPILLAFALGRGVQH